MTSYVQTTSYALVSSPRAAAGWGPTRSEGAARGGHLTRRGRIVRALVLVALLGWLLVLAIGRLTGQPALAGDESAGLVVPTHSVTVADGDSLWGIALEVAPSADPREVVLEIQEINGLTTSTIQPGQVLLVPATVAR